MEKRETFFLAFAGTGDGSWDTCKQVPLFCSWQDAVITAKLQDVPTRLSKSAGFNNQGHYFQPEPNESFKSIN